MDAERNQATAAEDSPRPFVVALSYPGEDTDLIRAVAGHLGDAFGKERVFFAPWCEVRLWGKNGDLKLEEVYGEQSEFVVPFFSARYEKPWCRLEWDAMRAMLLKRRSQNAVLPIQLDETVPPGWHATDFAIRRDQPDAREIADRIIEKLELNGIRRNAQVTRDPGGAKRGAFSADQASGSPGVAEASTVPDPTTMSPVMTAAPERPDLPVKTQTIRTVTLGVLVMTCLWCMATNCGHLSAIVVALGAMGSAAIISEPGR